MGQGKWTHKTAAKIADLLRKPENGGIKVCATTVRRLLAELDYSLKSNRKCLSAGNAPGRDAQFRKIDTLRCEFTDAGEPIISVDTKKKELIGNFKNTGRTWRRKARKVNDHDFRSQAKGRAVPYGIYDITENAGLLVVGQSADTPEFAVNCIRQWWLGYGQSCYPAASRLLILADSGGSNGASPRARKLHLQEKIADELGLVVRVAHYPSGASKWNPIEHRMFSEISKNWQAEPLIEFDYLVNFAANTTTATGLHIEAERDQKTYEKGQKISDAQMRELSLTRDKELAKWNYTISPRTTPRLKRPTPEMVIPQGLPHPELPRPTTHEEVPKMSG